jgi:hypothetical protein
MTVRDTRGRNVRARSTAHGLPESRGLEREVIPNAIPARDGIDPVSIPAETRDNPEPIPSSELGFSGILACNSFRNRDR